MKWTTAAFATLLLLASRPALATEPDDATASAEPATEMNSVGMAIAGGVMSGVGTLILAGSVIAYTQSGGEDCDATGLSGALACAIEDELESDVERSAMVGAMVVGAVHLAVGIPLLVAGVWRVPLDEGDARAGAIHAPELTLGPGGVGMRFQF